MKKIAISRFGGPEVLELIEVPTPPIGAHDVLVKSHTIGMGWPDVFIRTGTYPWQHLFPMPATPGIEMTGNVIAVGSAVKDFQPGQPVYVSSGMMGMTGACYTEERVVAEDRLIALPPDLSLETAANIGYYTIAQILLNECLHGFPVRSVMVSGASGGIGTAIVQTAKAQGLKVIATIGTQAKRAHAIAMGADHVLNYREDDLPARVKDITSGEGVDLVLDAWGGPQLAKALYCMGPWGTLILYNAVGGHPDSSFFDDWRKNMGKCLSVMYFSMHMWENDYTARRIFINRAIDLLHSGKVDPPPAKLFPLSRAADAHRLLEAGNHVGRIFLKP